jgi:hypothetical protein
MKQEQLLMKTLSDKAKPMAVLGVLALVAIVTMAPHALAQQNGIPLGPPYGTGGQQPSTTGSDSAVGWSAGMAVMAVMTGVGVWSAVRKH